MALNSLDNIISIETKALQLRAEVPHLIAMLSQTPESVVCIKDHQSRFQYSNQKFRDLFGIQRAHELKNLTSFDLCRDRSLAKLYAQHDQLVLDTQRPLNVCADIKPKHDSNITEILKGTLYPLQLGIKKASAVVIVTHSMLQFKMRSLEDLLSLSASEVSFLLKKRSYPVRLSWGYVNIAKRELECLIQILMGKHAGEIAVELKLRQTTIESYVTNLKNKLGVCGRSELVAAAISARIFQQVFSMW